MIILFLTSIFVNSCQSSRMNWSPMFSRSAWHPIRGPFSLGFHQDRIQDWNKIWLATGTVPDKVKNVPTGQVLIEYPWNLHVRPNTTLTSGITYERPQLRWRADPDKLYTLIFEDNDINNPQFGQIKFWHWLVVNIPGCDVEKGEELMSYIAPFAFDFNPETGLVKEQGTGAHRFIFLVYEQPGRIQPTESQNTCDQSLLSRTQDHDEFAEKYDLKTPPVAGNFIRVGYSGQVTDSIVCYFTQCFGSPLPVEIEGVNTPDACPPITQGQPLDFESVRSASHRSQASAGQGQDWNEIWLSTNTVPDKLKNLPTGRLMMDFNDVPNVIPNTVLTSQNTLDKPQLRWDADPNKYYTLIFEDNDINNEMIGQIKFFHWMVVNIPGSDVSRGEEIISYVPSFAYNFTSETGLDTRIGSGSHRYLFLVYEQPGRIKPTESQINCDNSLFGRVLDHDEIAKKYNLKVPPVAGNFIRVGYSGELTNRVICYFSQCLGMPFPNNIPGVSSPDVCPIEKQSGPPQPLNFDRFRRSSAASGTSTRGGQAAGGGGSSYQGAVGSSTASSSSSSNSRLNNNVRGGGGAVEVDCCGNVISRTSSAATDYNPFSNRGK